MCLFACVYVRVCVHASAPSLPFSLFLHPAPSLSPRVSCKREACMNVNILPAPLSHYIQCRLTALPRVENIDVSHNQLTALDLSCFSGTCALLLSCAHLLLHCPCSQFVFNLRSPCLCLPLPPPQGLQDLKRIDVSHNPLDGGVCHTDVSPPNDSVELCVANTHMPPAHIDALTAVGWRVVQ